MISLSVTGIAFPIAKLVEDVSHLAVSFTLYDEKNIVAIAHVVACDEDGGVYTLRVKFEKISSPDKETLSSYIAKQITTP